MAVVRLKINHPISPLDAEKTMSEASQWLETYKFTRPDRDRNIQIWIVRRLFQHAEELEHEVDRLNEGLVFYGSKLANETKEKDDV